MFKSNSEDKTHSALTVLSVWKDGAVTWLRCRRSWAHTCPRVVFTQVPGMSTWVLSSVKTPSFAGSVLNFMRIMSNKLAPDCIEIYSKDILLHLEFEAEIGSQVSIQNVRKKLLKWLPLSSLHTEVPWALSAKHRSSEFRHHWMCQESWRTWQLGTWVDVLQRPCCGTRTEVFTTGGFCGLPTKMKKEGVESFISSCCIQKLTLRQMDFILFQRPTFGLPTTEPCRTWQEWQAWTWEMPKCGDHKKREGQRSWRRALDSRGVQWFFSNISILWLELVRKTWLRKTFRKPFPCKLTKIRMKKIFRNDAGRGSRCCRDAAPTSLVSWRSWQGGRVEVEKQQQIRTLRLKTSLKQYDTYQYQYQYYAYQHIKRPSTRYA